MAASVSFEDAIKTFQVIWTLYAQNLSDNAPPPSSQIVGQLMGGPVQIFGIDNLLSESLLGTL